MKNTKKVEGANLGWEVDPSSIVFEGTVANEPGQNDPTIQLTFTLKVGEACQPAPKHLQTLYEGREFKLLVRRVSEHEYWYLDTNGHEGHFTQVGGIEFCCSEWEKVRLSTAQDTVT